jgi:integrase
MPKEARKLQTDEISRITQDTAVGGVPGLTIQCRGNGKFYVLRRMVDGRRVQIGIGSSASIDLKTARIKANEVIRQLALGNNVLEQRREARAAQAAARAEKAAKSRIPTFEQAAQDFIGLQCRGWKDGVMQSHNWLSSLRRWAFPHIGDKRVSDVDLQSLLPIFTAPVDGGTFWAERRATADTVRQRIAKILDWAENRGFRTGRNPASMFALRLDLPSGGRKPLKHHGAMAYSDIPAFFARLRGEDSTLSRAFQFLILTVGRPDEARGAKWSEIDLEGKLWHIPGGRMKGKVDHTVPLSGVALHLLRFLPKSAEWPDSVFPGMRGNEELCTYGFSRLLKNWGIKGVTAHGFRASFRSWGEDKGYPASVLEPSLAHKEKDVVVRTYNRLELRSALPAARRELMETWAAFVTGGNAP